MVITLYNLLQAIIIIHVVLISAVYVFMIFFPVTSAQYYQRLCRQLGIHSAHSTPLRNERACTLCTHCIGCGINNRAAMAHEGHDPE